MASTDKGGEAAAAVGKASVAATGSTDLGYNKTGLNTRVDGRDGRTWTEGTDVDGRDGRPVFNIQSQLLDLFGVHCKPL